MPVIISLKGIPLLLENKAAWAGIRERIFSIYDIYFNILFFSPYQEI